MNARTPDHPAAGAGTSSVPLSLVHDVRPPAPGANAEGARPPLLILLHGVGANERQMAALAPAFDPRFVVVSARSPLTLGRGPSGQEAFGWFHVTFTPEGPVIDRDEAAAGWAHVARFADEAAAAYGADPARVYVGGFSQGGIMALAALLTAPERIAGAVAMSGRLLPEVLPQAAPADALRGRRALVVHGTADEKLGIHLARWAREQLARFPLALTYRELPMGHGITDESVRTAAGWLTAALDGRSDGGSDATEEAAR
ncbi:alpha/beta fold hydrolase [Roseisolibacter sp. H3M3-2]|uniref:alpha/beta hydrolase n=1 Tax=Roseisolibacter sp. H3M3-2 TaxID=3031323 RepID=UPI0023DB60E5|nr:alpha/beta fold hydrolase [Roseisolibacter sp. H3M3-2]MDF1501396.1 alpha/beta fold hydrolase [Roseisolibacter sp. H3M3-2]